jgi:hypothetical protein
VGAVYFIPVIIVPVLMITHAAAFYLLIRPNPSDVRIVTS